MSNHAMTREVAERRLYTLAATVTEEPRRGGVERLLERSHALPGGHDLRETALVGARVAGEALDLRIARMHPMAEGHRLWVHRAGQRGIPPPLSRVLLAPTRRLVPGASVPPHRIRDMAGEQTAGVLAAGFHLVDPSRKRHDRLEDPTLEIVLDRWFCPCHSSSISCLSTNRPAPA